MIRHGHGINCLHVYGWFLSAWCPECRKAYESFEEPGHCSREEGFERHADAMLALAILDRIESGDIAPPPGYDAPERTRPLTELVAPSAN